VSKPEQNNDDDRLTREIEELASELLDVCQEAKFYAGTQKQREFVDALQDFLGMVDDAEEST
jgi:hypothetical protein